MTTWRQRAGTILIATCCTWHMLSIGLYNAIPQPQQWQRVESQNPLIDLLLYRPLRLVEDVAVVSQYYVLLLSQWQSWSLFAPNPITYTYDLNIETLVDTAWIHTATVPSTYVHPYSTKLVSELQKEQFAAAHDAIVDRFCARTYSQPVTAVRLVLRMTHVTLHTTEQIILSNRPC